MSHKQVTQSETTSRLLDHKPQVDHLNIGHLQKILSFSIDFILVIFQRRLLELRLIWSIINISCMILEMTSFFWIELTDEAGSF